MRAKELEIVPFEEKHLDGAARLLAARQRALRRAQPFLPSEYEEPKAARAAVDAAFSKPRTSGVAALRRGVPAAFLMGAIVTDDVIGRTAWMPVAGYAHDQDVDPALYRHLYATLSPPWIDQGCFAHYAMVPAVDGAVLDTWYSLSFGRQQVHAVLSLDVQIPDTEAPPGTEIRRADMGDLERILDIAHLISAYQAGPPVYAPTLPEFRAELREGWSEVLGDSENAVWLAVRDGAALAVWLMMPYSRSSSEVLAPEGAVELKVAVTREDVRGTGIGKAVTKRALAWAKETGFRWCVTDWRSTNLLSSRFWPGRGFEPVAYRLVRRIDERIAWAR